MVKAKAIEAIITSEHGEPAEITLTRKVQLEYSDGTVETYFDSDWNYLEYFDWLLLVTRLVEKRAKGKRNDRTI